MSDLIARLEDQIEAIAEYPTPFKMTDAHETLAEIAAALRQKEAEIAELKREALALACQAGNYATELSALRDQQPVAHLELAQLVQDAPWSENGYFMLSLGLREPLVAALSHTSCVSPDQPEKQNTGDTSGVASDQSKRPADSNESAGHP